MKFSTRGRYAIRAAMCLAEKYGQGPIPLKHIAEDQHISAKYLEVIMRLMSTAGIVSSSKGNRGGFSLAKDPKNITVFDILKVAEGSLLPVDCVESLGTCINAKTCTARDMWVGLRDVMTKYLKDISLYQLALGHVKKLGRI
jgi:Rrf2 family cysteine metabolism transcriptional repressor